MPQLLTEPVHIAFTPEELPKKTPEILTVKVQDKLKVKTRRHSPLNGSLKDSKPADNT